MVTGKVDSLRVYPDEVAMHFLESVMRKGRERFGIDPQWASYVGWSAFSGRPYRKRVLVIVQDGAVAKRASVNRRGDVSWHDAWAGTEWTIE